jgi:ATP-dependent helicase HrpA
VLARAQQLLQLTDAVMLVDRHRLQRRARDLVARCRQGADVVAELERLDAQVGESAAERARRAQLLPRPEFIDDLPINLKRNEIAQVIAQHQVVVICGETGSGKTTQLPKMCLELGRGVAGLIGHTQPRRIAARTLAARIAQELNSAPGRFVGYKVRFSDHTGPDTFVKVMTDGILLAETQADRFLNQYDTLIIDEAHERSLNIDFLLGYLRNLLPKRPDLKLIVTSATIDPQRFAAHFGNAPVIEVSGRMYPVETRYRPRAETSDDDEPEDELQALVRAVDEVAHDGGGDILVFLSGEREIREAAEALRKHHPDDTEILPLYSRLSVQEQQRVFVPHPGRRIVLATNVAETSLTVPGIRYVIDTGVARISRYSHRTKIQRLPVEPVSQASADQRKGRCGRVGPGVCIRLYSEEDYLGRPRFTDPEIQRTNLANVILQMKAMRLGDIENFPFVDPPDGRLIRDGVRLLDELQALDGAGELSAIGSQLARFPVDPRLGRMLIAAHKWGCLREMLVIVSGLSVQDPRERPLDRQQQADNSHHEFQDEKSDFQSLLKLWTFFDAQHAHLSRHKLRQLCRKRFLSYTRMLEWRDIHSQLVTLCHELELRENVVEAQYYDLHQALLTGLLGNLGMRGEEREYIGARDNRFHVFPGSALFKKAPKWIMAAQLIETTRVYAHFVAAIEPQWVETAAQHLTKRSYFEPHWEKARGEAAVYERVTLYGLPIVAKRKVNYGRVNARDAREIFIRHALVQGDYDTRAAFFHHNRGLMEQVQDLEHKSRRQDILVDEATLHAFYDARVPADIHNARRFEAWVREHEKQDPRFLYLTRDELMRHDAGAVSGEQFPDALAVGGARLPLRYRFEPGHEDDGVTLELPVVLLHQIDTDRLDWLVPGLLRDKVIELIRSLPKNLRRNFVPVPQYADAVLGNLTWGDGVLRERMAEALRRMTGVAVAREAWNDDALPLHLRMNVRVIDADGQCVAHGRDLRQLWTQADARGAVESGPATAFERDGIRSWDFGDLPESIEFVQQGVRVKRYPALVDGGDSVALRLMETAERARAESLQGVRRLLMQQTAQTVKYLRKNLPGLQAACVKLATVIGCDALRDQLILRGYDAAFQLHGDVPRSADAFAQLVALGSGRVVEQANALCAVVAQIAEEYHALRQSLQRAGRPFMAKAVNDVREQVGFLLGAGFVLATPSGWLAEIPRYLRAARARVDKLESGLARDEQASRELAPLWKHFVDHAQRLSDARSADSKLLEYRWLLEELRVSLYAQELKTRVPVSAKRLTRLWDEIRRALT